MESLVSLVFLGVIYSVLYVVKSMLSRNQDVVGTPVMDEAFPQVDVIEPAEDTSHSCSIPEMSPVNKNKKVNTSHNNYMAVANDMQRTTKDLPAVPVLTNTERKEKRVSFNDKSEAKRAVIYSEIFNRKYK